MYFIYRQRRVTIDVRLDVRLIERNIQARVERLKKAKKRKAEKMAFEFKTFVDSSVPLAEYDYAGEPENTNNRSLHETVIRVNRMEELFDFVADILHNTPSELQSPSVRDAIRVLTDYYENGNWLYDYELDEQRVLPSDLKRGVLSQDGLYDLLSGINEIKTD